VNINKNVPPTRLSGQPLFYPGFIHGLTIFIEHKGCLDLLPIYVCKWLRQRKRLMVRIGHRLGLDMSCETQAGIINHLLSLLIPTTGLNSTKFPKSQILYYTTRPPAPAQTADRPDGTASPAPFTPIELLG
jgi:hypothetical protein